MDMGIEFELKYRANRQQQAAIRQAFAGEEEIYEMHTTYYDTPAGSFSARKCTLRRRMENQRSVCTLKTPGGGHGRREWEVECDSIEEAIEKLCNSARRRMYCLWRRKDCFPSVVPGLPGLPRL